MLAILEKLAGAALLLLALTDIFLTVLYARAGVAIISRPLALAVWRVFRAVARRSGKHCRRVLSYCGPSVVVVLLLNWAGLLTLATALILHPALGGAVKAQSGSTPHDLITALYAGGSSISIVGAGPVAPQTTGYRLFYLLTSLVGVSIVSLAVTYLMQLYSALQERNGLALKVEAMTGRTGDGARLLAGLGPDGRFEAGYSNLADLAAELSATKEAHHLYPVLFYFHFPQPFYDMARVTLVLMDMSALIRTALEPKSCGWLARTASLEHLVHGGEMLADTLQRVYLTRWKPEGSEPGEDAHAAWRTRYRRALDVLRENGVPVRRDMKAGEDAYVAERQRWDPLLMALGRAMLMPVDVVDPAGAHD